MALTLTAGGAMFSTCPQFAASVGSDQFSACPGEGR